jgi:hypothetical protein
MIVPSAQRRFVPVRSLCNVKWMLLAAAIFATFVSPANAYRRWGRSYAYSAMRARQRQYLNIAAASQLNAARQVLAAAESTGSTAQSKLDASLAKLTEEAQKFHEAQSMTRHAAKELAEIEKEILEEQPEDSPYVKATKSVEATHEKIKTLEQRILQEQSVEVELSGLTGSKLAEKKESILSLRPEYIEAKALLNMQGSELAHIRSELFHSDKHWKEAAESLTQARKEEKDAEKMTHSGASGRVGLRVTARNASEAAVVARTAIAQAEAVLRMNGGGRYLTQPGSSGSRYSPSTNSGK